MRPVYVLYPADRYALRLKTRSWWKAVVYRVWLWLKYKRPVLTDIKRTNGY